MNLAFRSNKDFWAGMMLFVLGTGAMFVARDYPLVLTLHLGPGYFPISGSSGRGITTLFVK